MPLETAWLTKPDGVSYAEFMPTLDAVGRSGATLWQRQMVFGPAPEFAAQTRGGLAHVRALHITHTDVLA